PRRLLREAQRRRVAAEDDVIDVLLAQVVAQRLEDRIGVGEAQAAAQEAQVDPRRQALVEPVAAPPAAVGRGHVDVAEVRQTDHEAVFSAPGSGTAAAGVRTIAATVPGAGTARAGGRQSSEGSSSMPKVTFVNEKKEIEVPAGSNLREEAAKAAISVYE